MEIVNKIAKFKIGQVVQHKLFPFRGVIFDADPVFSSSDDWWLSIPKDIRPEKNQPYYHILAENGDIGYVAYVSEQNLTADNSGEPINHPQISEVFSTLDDGTYTSRLFKPN